MLASISFPRQLLHVAGLRTSESAAGFDALLSNASNLFTAITSALTCILVSLQFMCVPGNVQAADMIASNIIANDVTWYIAGYDRLPAQ